MNRLLSLLSIVCVVILIAACSQLDEGTLTTSENSTSSQPTDRGGSSSQQTSGGSATSSRSSAQVTTTMSTPDTTSSLTPSPAGKSSPLQDWCRIITTSNLDASRGYIKRIIGNEMKLIMGTEVDLCHYSALSLNTSIKTDSWESEKGKYPYYKFEEVTVGGVLSSNELQVTKKENNVKTKCTALNRDVTKADIVLRCE